MSGQTGPVVGRPGDGAPTVGAPTVGLPQLQTGPTVAPGTGLPQLLEAELRQARAAEAEVLSLMLELSERAGQVARAQGEASQRLVVVRAQREVLEKLVGEGTAFRQD